MKDPSGRNAEPPEEVSVLKHGDRDSFERLAEEMAIIAEIGRVVSSTLDINEVYERFAAEAKKLIAFDRIVVNLNDPQKGIICTEYTSGLDVPGRRPGDFYPLAGSLNEILMKTRTGVINHPSSSEEIVDRCPGLVPAFRAGMRSIIAVPLISRDVVIGGLHFHSKMPKAHTEQDLRLAERIGAQIAGAMASAQLYKDLKETEKSLRESEGLLRVITDNMSDMIRMTDLKGINLYTSPSHFKGLGYKVNDRMGKSIFDIVHPDDLERVMTLFSEVLAGKRRAAVDEYRVRHADGHYVWLETVGDLLRDVQGNATAAVMSSRDISRRKATAEELRRSEEKYRTLIETTRTGFVIVDGDGTVLDANPEYVRLTGRQGLSEIVGRRVIEWTADYEKEKNAAAVEECFRTGYIRNLEIDYVDSKGRITPVEIDATYMESEGVAQVLTLCRDITERKRAEEERRVLEERLRHADKMEAVGTLAGGIAHDFNNLLMGIQGYASLTLLELDPAHPHYERLKRIEEQVQSGADLTKQLLGFARGGRYEVKPADMNEIVLRSSTMFGRTKKEITIHRKLGSDLRNVEVDRGQMEQVFMNLYVNAWQAMPGGGEIYLETENVILGEGESLPYSVAPGAYVEVSVTDTGTGMDEKTKARIFDPFFTTKGMGRGTGLGLATVYGIIKGHRGMIRAESDPGRGTTFSIYLPVSEKEVARERTEEGPIARGRETILLADDEKMVLEVSRELLEYLGYRVYAVGSGQEAVAVYLEKRNEIDLVILDMIMPGISGGETFDRLRGIDPGVRVLLSSGYSLSGEARTIIDRGCNGFIQKPFQLEKLSRKIREMLDQDGAFHC